MVSEQEFIDAIKKEPKNDLLRLVFADWLEERGRVVASFRLRTVVNRAPWDNGSEVEPDVWATYSIGETDRSDLPEELFSLMIAKTEQKEAYHSGRSGNKWHMFDKPWQVFIDCLLEWALTGDST